MLKRLVTLAAWSCLIFIVFATLSPRGLRPTLTRDETFYVVVIERFGAYALLGALFIAAYYRHILFVCFTVFGSAISLELLQLLIPGRHGRVPDAIEKLIGGAVGILLVVGLRAIFSSANKRRPALPGK